MGRAFPELQMTTFNAHGVSTTPLALTDDHGTWLLLEAPDAGSAEAMIRTVSVALGCSAVLCSYPMTGRQARECTVHGTLSVARDVGRAIHSGSRSVDPVAALMDRLRSTPYYAQCRLLFDGRVVDVRREVGRRLLGRLRAPRAPGGPRPLDGDRVPERVPPGAGGGAPARHCPGPRVSRGTRDRAAGAGGPGAVRAAPEGARRERAARDGVRRSRCPIFGPRAFGLQDAFVPLESLADG